MKGRTAARAVEALLCSLVLAAIGCDRKPPPAPPTVDSGSAETITGRERLGWNQRAADTAELASIRYAIYVDGARSELPGSTCAPTPSADGFACSAPIPRLSAGTHTLQLASFIIDGSLLESARSAVLRVIVAPVTSRAATSVVVPDWPHHEIVTTADGVTFRLELVSGDVSQPADLAVAPDGRVFVAERGGAVRILPDRRDGVVANGELIALALDPQFARTHWVYVIYTGPSRSGGRGFSLARFRETAGTLGDRAILLDDVPATADEAAASLRVGPDGKLYAAFGAGGDSALTAEMSSPNGKVLRMNGDGSTPDDQAGATPVYAGVYRAPRGLDWQPASGTLWIADEPGTLHAVGPDDAAPGGKKRGITRHTYSLPRETNPSAIAFYRGTEPALRDNLLIASTAGHHLLRIRLDAQAPSAIVGTERLLERRIGGIRAVASAPDGSIYLATEHAIGRLVPVR